MTEDRGIPQRLRTFLDVHFDSVEQIEVLLLLSQHPDRFWTASEVDNELRSSPTVLLRRLNSLHKIGALERAADATPRFRFNPNSTEIQEQIQELLDHYRLRRSAIIELIYSRPRRALQSFVDAFKLSNKEDSDG